MSSSRPRRAVPRHRWAIPALGVGVAAAIAITGTLTGPMPEPTAPATPAVVYPQPSPRVEWLDAYSEPGCGTIRLTYAVLPSDAHVEIWRQIDDSPWHRLPDKPAVRFDRVPPGSLVGYRVAAGWEAREVWTQADDCDTPTPTPEEAPPTAALADRPSTSSPYGRSGGLTSTGATP